MDSVPEFCLPEVSFPGRHAAEMFITVALISNWWNLQCLDGGIMGSLRGVAPVPAIPPFYSKVLPVAGVPVYLSRLREN